MSGNEQWAAHPDALRRAQAMSETVGKLVGGTLREKILAALCTDHGHFSRDKGMSCRTCNRRADRVMAVLAEHSEGRRQEGQPWWW